MKINAGEIRVGMLLEFKRWFPTYLVDRFGKAGYGSYIDDFGNVYRGSTQATLKNLQLYANPLKYKENKGKLDKATRDAIERYHRGMLVPLIIGLALVASGDDEDMDDADLDSINDDDDLNDDADDNKVAKKRR